MADFPTALYGALRAWYGPDRSVRSPIDSTRGRNARMHALERAYGSGPKAAAAAGIGASSWRAWKTSGSSKRGISAANQRKLDDAYRSLVRAVTVRRRGTPTLMTVTAVVVADPRKSRYVNAQPHRSFKAEKGGAREAAEEFLAGGTPDGVAAAALAGIADGYGTEFAFEGQDVTVDLS